MPTIDKNIEVAVPVTTAYNQWTQFEEFPAFMEGVLEVRQIDDTHLHWVAEIGGRTKEWDAEIIDQHPDERIAWRSTGGMGQDGIVTFEPMGERSTMIRLHVDYETDGLMEKAGDMLGVADRRVENDLERFRDLIEGRGTSTGAWRGTVDPR